jgi:hypothetical protein
MKLSTNQPFMALHAAMEPLPSKPPTSPLFGMPFPQDEATLNLAKDILRHTRLPEAPLPVITDRGMFAPGEERLGNRLNPFDTVLVQMKTVSDNPKDYAAMGQKAVGIMGETTNLLAKPPLFHVFDPETGGQTLLNLHQILHHTTPLVDLRQHFDRLNTLPKHN